MAKKGVKSKKQGVKDLTLLAKELMNMGILLAGGEVKEEKAVKISFDKSQDQFTIRIPKGMGKGAEINLKKDKFNFVFERKGGEFLLKGELIRDEK